MKQISRSHYYLEVKGSKPVNLLKNVDPNNLPLATIGLFRVVKSFDFITEEYMDSDTLYSRQRCMYVATGERCVKKTFIIQDNQEIMKWLDKDLSSLQQVLHPNIARVIGYSIERGKQFIAIEEYRCSLWDLIYSYKEFHRITLETKMEWMLQMASALSVLHQSNIIHRNISSRSLYIKVDGGIMLSEVTSSKVKQLTEKATGKPSLANWAAPEYLRNEVCDERIDICSFGFIMYELLTGEIPYQEMDHIFQVCSSIIDGKRPDVSKIVTSNPKVINLIDLMKECWDGDRDKRPPSWKRFSVDKPTISERLAQISNDP